MEEGIIAAAVAGDRVALAAVVDEFTPTVLGAAYGLCGDLHQAGDIAQEVFATVVSRIGDLREPAALPGWLMAITRTAARRQRRLDPPVPAAPPEPGPEDVVVARDEARRLRLAVEALPADERLPMVLHYFAGHRLAEIAGLCGLPLSTVKKRMRVARARLRKGMDPMDTHPTDDLNDCLTAGLRPDRAADPSDVIRLYTAMRAGDTERVAAMLDERPDLVDVREDWSRADSFAHRLPLTRGGGTPLLRAVERGDEAMVRLLLSRGADANGACTCEGGERPLWVAVAQHETAIAEVLLAHGAAPDVTAFAGASAVDVARRRGYDDLVELLLRRGATPGSWASTPGTGAVPDVVATSTGIKAVDLWCPLPERGLAHLTPGFGLGAFALVAELSHRAARGGRRVVWTGFVQAPTDLGDVHHGLADTALTGDVRLSMAPPSAPLPDQIAALDAGIRLAGEDAVLVVFVEHGRWLAVDERLLALSTRDALTLVVAPLDGTGSPPAMSGNPYLASIVFDVDRARRRRWPAVGAESWSKVADPTRAALAARARDHLTDELDRYLTQPFYVAEHVSGAPGEWVGTEELEERVAALVPA